MNFKTQRGSWLRWLLGGMVLPAVLVSFVLVKRQTSSFVAHDSAGSPKVQKEERTLHIFDKSRQGRELLFSRISNGDLWLQDSNGHERCIASNVNAASFSPDGKKFAYANGGYELFIETIDGKQLAHLTGALDHSWRADSAAVTFSAMASSDYPDLQQTVIYDLDRSQATHLPANE